MRLVEVRPQDDFILYVMSENGETGVFDVSPYLNSEAFQPLKNKEEFKKIHNGEYFVEWACGADLSADTIEARWKKHQAR
ncbi:MAG: hypothetical protein A2286_10880 [Gammaproteobacteria bacterium RIFOXYA12_FULL_61_12]|nr:MAG: hypothetical protein A2514_03630 [Gammaproteobacteria bacterium RIFOXYD12_FULL_61_37]OGT93002.1 MAG: hypothetical protein A2286_10880 [Gammaproteobacteria bacterium RIFOXYA12_FULL_61_12]